MWYDDFKIGDKMAFNINRSHRFTGETQEFILTEELLGFIKRFEDNTNYHGFRVIKQYV